MDVSDEQIMQLGEISYQYVKCTSPDVCWLTPFVCVSFEGSCWPSLSPKFCLKTTGYSDIT